MVSGAAKTAVAMKDVDVEIDLNGNVSSKKVSDGSWMSAMNDVKKESEQVAVALEFKNSLLSKKRN